MAMAGLESCATGGLVKAALQILEYMSEDGLVISSMAYYTAIRACETAGDWETALQLACTDKSCVTSMLCIRSYQIVTDLQQVIWKHVLQACSVLQLMLQQPNMQVTPFLWNIVAAAIGRAGRWEELLKFIADGTTQYSAVFDIRTYTTAMIACHEAQQWQKVLEVAALIQHSDLLQVDEVTAALALHACDQLNGAGFAAKFSSSLQGTNIQPISNIELLHWLAHRHDATVNSIADEPDVHADDQQSEQIASNSSDDSSDDRSQQYNSDSDSTTTSSSVSNDVVVVTHTKAAAAGTATQ
eukprot:15737-Heterococcus_DN1.PRE.2